MALLEIETFATCRQIIYDACLQTYLQMSTAKTFRGRTIILPHFTITHIHKNEDIMTILSRQWLYSRCTRTVTSNNRRGTIVYRNASTIAACSVRSYKTHP